MERIRLGIGLLWLVSLSFCFGQGFQDPFQFPEQSTMAGGLGMTWIDGQPHTTFTLAPDFAFGKFGMGIYLQFLLDNNNQWKLREDEYDDGPKILRAIRYIRYGQKYDPYYMRVGMIERATLASGYLVWNYSNSSSYDQRKIGLEADLDFGRFGFESLWSSVGTSNLRGANLYVRPFRFFETAVPLLQRIKINTTFVRDSKVNADPTRDSTTSLSAYSIGADFRWLDAKLLKSSLYADYAKFNDFGSGKVVGVNLIFPEFVGLFGLAARYERRFNGAQFIPNLFGPLYELDRNLNIFAKLRAAEKTEGYFGELTGHVIKRILLTGSYQRLNGIEQSGILHLEASAPNLVPKFELRGYYDKAGIGSFKDARTLDINSVLTAEISYQLNRFLLFTTIYRWYWVEDPEGSGIYKPLERVEPRISFRYNF